jgi:hypothetical protein
LVVWADTAPQTNRTVANGPVKNSARVLLFIMPPCLSKL